MDDLCNQLAPRYAVLSAEMADLFVSIERRIALGIDVPLCEFEAVLFACYAGPYGDFHTAKVFA
jgi:hypothetical protein